MQQPELVVGGALHGRHHPRRRLARLGPGAAGLALALLAVACGGSGGGASATTVGTAPASAATTAAATTAAPTTDAPTTPPPTTAPPTTAAPTTAPVALPLPAPEGDAFYTPPTPLPAGRPGDVIWARPTKGPAGARSWLVLYLSEDVQGRPVAVSGTVSAPDADATDRPIVAWGHGTVGIGDQCAPSKTFATGTSPEALLGALTVGQGRVFTSTDYEGLGTPGVHPYLVGISEGHAVLDSIRAAQRLAGTGAGPASKAVVWGHSQGGQAAAMAADLAPAYAPDANVVGAVVGSPAAELPTLFGGHPPATGPFDYAFMLAAGFKAAYPQLDLAAGFTPDGVKMVQLASTSCSGGTLAAAPAGQPASRYLQGTLATAPGWAEALRANSPGNASTSVPLFVYQGEADETVPVAISKLLLDRYCSVGDTAYRKTYPGATHTGVVINALGDIGTYIADRLAGKPAPTSCS